MHHRVRGITGAVQEGVEPFTGHVVHTGEPEHVELIEWKGVLHRPQRLDLTPHTDGQQSLDPTAGQLLEH